MAGEASYTNRERRFGGVFPTWLVPSARVRIALIYRWRLGRWPSVMRPARFTELVQARKLFARDRRMVAMSDKVAAKGQVASVLGSAWVTPTLWHGTELPSDPPGAYPLVVKARHGCGQIAFVRNADEWAAVRRRSARWTQRAYGRWLDEWAYAHIPRGIVVEPMIGGGVLPIDYKFIVIGGRVEAIEVHLDRGADHRWIVLDRDWRVLSRSVADRPDAPTCLAPLIAGAEALGQGHDCVRVDLYAIDGQPKFGEMTFYPGSGVTPIDPPELDLALGAAWLRAKERD